MKKFSVIFIVILLASSCTKTSLEIKDLLDKYNSGKGNTGIRVPNGNFEKPIDFSQPKKNDYWIEQGYVLNACVFTWEKNIGRNESAGVSIETVGAANDLAITQEIVLNPAKFYRLSVWIKTENVQGGAGANVCLFGTWSRSESVFGTTDWHQVSVDFAPPADGKITIGCRLGYWSAVSTGKVYFDDVAIEEVSKFTETGTHVRVVLDAEDAAVVKPQTITSWITNLDRAYEKYAELMGFVPYNGELITVLGVNTYPGGWAVAGNPILWYKPYISSELRVIESTGTWSFGIMHELGHDFVGETSNRSWIFNEELFANFRMYYVVEKLNATIVQGKIYHGAELESYYKTDGDGSYERGLARGILSGDGIMYTMVRIKNQIGWDPYIKAMKDLNTAQYPGGTKWQMFNLLLDKLTLYSGQDVRKTYPPGELDLIQQSI